MSDIELPDLPDLPANEVIPYSAIRYVNGYTKSFVHEYAQAYATAALLADREKRAQAAQPVAWAATSEHGVVEALGMNQSRRFDTPLYFAATTEASKPVQVEAPSHRPSPEWYRDKIAETLDDDFIIGPATKQAEAPPASNEREAFEAWRRHFIDRVGEKPGEWEVWQARAALATQQEAQPAAPIKCLTCSDTGWVGGPSFYNPGEGGEPCPDCAQAEPAGGDKEDAERYRLVRRGQHWSVLNGIGDILRGEELDAAVDAIDAARAAQQATGERG